MFSVKVTNAELQFNITATIKDRHSTTNVNHEMIFFQFLTLKGRGAIRDFTFMFWIIANDCTFAMIYLSHNPS